MSSTAGNNLFLLEAIVHRVALADPDDATTDTCVCFRFPELVDLDICDGGPCDAGTGNRRTAVTAGGRGKSCLFAVGASDLCRAAREFRADVTVYRRRADDAPRLVARAALRFDRTFTDIILNPDQPQRARELVQTLSLLYESRDGRSRRTGTVDVLVRLTSHGDLLVTEFFWDRDAKTYKYEGLDEYVPTTNASAPEHCPEKRIRPCPRKRCRRNEPAARAPKDHQDDKCSKHVRRVKCILDVMDQMKDMFLAAVAAAGTANVAKPCAFDPRCPVAGCPFVVDEPTRRLFAPNGKAGPRSVEQPPPPPPADDAEIVDGSDVVFGVTVGRADPCLVDVLLPTEYRNDFAQYSVASAPPPSSEVAVVEHKPPAKKFAKRKTKGKTTRLRNK